MNIILKDREITPEDFLAMPDANCFELLKGTLVERKMGGASSWVGGRVHYLLTQFCDAHSLGWVFPSDASFQCFPDKPKQVRLPDVSFVRRGRLHDETPPEGHIRLAPDLVVEVVSPNDLFIEIDEKVDDYLRAGTPLVWVIDPPLRVLYVHRADGGGNRLRETDKVTGETVLPGFECPVAALFPPAAESR